MSNTLTITNTYSSNFHLMRIAWIVVATYGSFVSACLNSSLYFMYAFTWKLTFISRYFGFNLAALLFKHGIQVVG